MLPEEQHCFSNARKRPPNRENTLRSVAENKRSAYLNGGITGEWCSYHPINYEIFSSADIPRKKNHRPKMGGELGFRGGMYET